MKRKHLSYLNEFRSVNFPVKHSGCCTRVQLPESCLQATQVSVHGMPVELVSALRSSFIFTVYNYHQLQEGKKHPAKGSLQMTVDWWPEYSQSR